MGLLVLESFDYCTTAELTSGNWTAFEGPASIVTNGGRTLHGFSGGPFKTFENSLLSCTMGMAFNVGGALTNEITFRNTLGAWSIRARGIGDGRFIVEASMGSGTNFTDPSTFVIHENTWYYMEFGVSVSPFNVPPSMGHPANTYFMRCNYDLRMNNATILSGTIDTPESGNIDPATGAGVLFVDNLNIATAKFASGIADDLYITDGEFLGDIAVVTLYPNADGSVDTFSPSAGINHYANVDDHPPDEETTYNAATGVGDTDLYQLEDLVPFTGDIKGTEAMFRVKKSDAGAASCEGVYGNEVFFTGAFYPSDVSYMYLCSPKRKSVFTGGDWTQSEINSLEIGLQRTS